MKYFGFIDVFSTVYGENGVKLLSVNIIHANKSSQIVALKIDPILLPSM